MDFIYDCIRISNESHQSQHVQNTSVHLSIDPFVPELPQLPSIPYTSSHGVSLNASNTRYAPYNPSSNNGTSSTVSNSTHNISNSVGYGPLQSISNNNNITSNNYTSSNVINGTLQTITNQIPYFGGLPITDNTGFDDNDFLLNTGKVHDVSDAVQNENIFNEHQNQLQPVYGYSIMEDMNEREENINSVNNNYVNNTYQQQYF